MSGPVIITCEQGTPEWFQARLGIPTASEFSTILAKGQGKTRAAYMRKLAGEIITNQPSESYSNGHMDRGKEMESEARAAYEFLTDNAVEEVGFIRTDAAGCSPDGLIGDDGGVEIKTKLPHLLIECLERGTLPPEHRAQVQGCLWITGRAWWDFVAYWPSMPIFTCRVEPDADYIAKLAEEVSAFNSELADLVARIKGMM